MNEEEARAALKEAGEQRLQRFAAELKELQERYRCRLIATPQITEDGRIVAPIAIALVDA